MPDASVCSSCGARLPAGAVTCDLCGQPVDEHEAPGTPAAASDPGAVPHLERGGDGAGPDPLGHRYCTQCGAKTPPGARFCSQCGTALHTDAPLPPVPAVTPASQATSATSAALGPRLALYIVGAVLLVGGLYLATVASRSGDAPPATFNPQAQAPGAPATPPDSTGFAPLSPESNAQVSALEAELEGLSGAARTSKQAELVNLLVGLGRPDRAADIAEQAATQAPSPAAWKRAGDLLYRWMEVLPERQRGTVAPRVVAAYDRVLASTPDDLDARTNLGWAAQYDASGNPMRAITETNDVLKRDSTHLGASYNRAWFLRSIGRLDQAIAQFEKVRKLSGPDTPLGREAQLMIEDVRRQQNGGSAPTPAPAP